MPDKQHAGAPMEKKQPRTIGEGEAVVPAPARVRTSSIDDAVGTLE
jgi:hypothetical protein